MNKTICDLLKIQKMEFEFLPCTKVIGPREDPLLVFALMDIILNCAHRIQKCVSFIL